MATVNIKDAGGSIVSIEKPNANGRVAATYSRPVALSTEDLAAVNAISTSIGAVADSPAANTVQARLAAIVAAIGNIPAGGDASEATLLEVRDAITGLLPEGKTAATEETLADIAGDVKTDKGAGAVGTDTHRVTLATDDPVVQALGATDDAEADDDDGDHSLIALTKRGLTTDKGAGAVSNRTHRMTMASDDPLVAAVGSPDITPAADDSGSWSILAFIKRQADKFTTLLTVLGAVTANPTANTIQDRLKTIGAKDFSTAAKQDALATLVGEVQASPTTNTLLDRLKTLATLLTASSVAQLGARTVTQSPAVNIATDDPIAKKIGTRAYSWGSIISRTITSSDQSATAVSATGEYEIATDTDCYINVNAAATTGKRFLPAGAAFTVQLTIGDVVHVIRKSADGNLTILPVA